MSEKNCFAGTEDLFYLTEAHYQWLCNEIFLAENGSYW